MKTGEVRSKRHVANKGLLAKDILLVDCWSNGQTVHNGSPLRRASGYFYIEYSFTAYILLNNRVSFVHSFIYQWLYSPLLRPGLFFSFVMLFTQTVGLLGRGISPDSRPLSTERTTQTQNIRTHIHPCLELDSNPRSQYSSQRRSSCFRPRVHCDRPCSFRPCSSSPAQYYCEIKLFLVLIN
jgi:hypothetical protein